MAKTYDIALKLLIIIVFSYIVIKYVANDNRMHLDLIILQEAFIKRWYLLLAVISLMPLNWMLESQKWRLVMNSYTSVSYRTAITSILCGVTCGLVTPARVGEFMGRLLNVRGDEKKVSLYASFICSISQNAVTLILGLIASLFFIDRIAKIEITIQQLLVVHTIIIIVALGLYFYHHKLLQRFSDTRFYSKHLHFLSDMHIDRSLLYRVLALSLLRYTVYGTQYILVLTFLSSSVLLLDNAIAVGTIFLIQSSIPLPPMMGLLARGEIAIFILGLLSYSSAIALLAAGLLWVINLICPALLGLVYLMKMNLWKSLST